jgi:hypothetical protein
MVFPASRDVPGLGKVPLWAPEHRRPPCEFPTGASDRIVAIAKGNEPTISDGSADLLAFITEVGGRCSSAERALAQSFFEGGEKLWAQKKFTEANRWQRAALVAWPQHDGARYDIARGLVRMGDPDDAVWAISELARAAKDNDPEASNFLERAKTDDELKSLRDQQAFKDAAAASFGALVGPRNDAALAAQIPKLLPGEYRLGPKPNGGMRQYHPTTIDIWTWRPDASTELVLARLICDPAVLDQPKMDVSSDYGALAVFRRDGTKLDLLWASKTGYDFPAIAPTKSGGVVYKFPEACGDLKGVLHWKDGAVEAKSQSCNELPP